MEIALPLIAGTGAKVSDRAVKLVAKITAELAPLSRDAALVAHRRLLAVLPVRHGRWQQTIRTHVEMLDGAAREQFMRRVAAGRGTENGEMSALQRELIDALAMLVRRSSATAETARQRLAAHLQPWGEHGHFAVVEGAWARIAPALPAAQQRRVALTTVQLQVEAVLREHRRLQSAGRTVPRQLDPVLAGALKRLHLLQDGVAHASAFGNEVQQAWDGIVGHYVALEYFETAREALAVRGERPVALATQYAELQAARLSSRLAERELVRLLARHDGRRQIELTPAFRTALDAFLKFLTDHPESDLSPAAIEGVTHIASVFEQHQAYRAAAVVLGDFAAAAERIPLATQVEPAGISAAERAQLRRVRALHAAARHQLGDALAHRLPGAAPPSELSVEYLAAAAAYRQFLMQNPGSRLWGEAVTGSMTIGVEYANVGGWDVAERVYAALLEAGLSLRHPERLQFCRGLCKLGPSMPDHARQVLVALVSRPIAAPGGASAPTPGADPRSGSDDFFLGRKERSKDKVRGLVAGARASTATAEVHEEPMVLMMVANEKVLQTIRQQEAGRAAAIAQLRDHSLTRVAAQGGQQVQQAQQLPVTLSPAELARLRASIDAAYEVFMAILKGHPHTPTAEQARAELMVMIGHWRSLAQWADAAGLAERFLRDRPDDAELPKLRLEVARDYLSLAAMPVRSRDSVQSKLAITAQRFDAARTALLRIPADFPRRRALVHQAQWDVAQSWLSQARAVAAFSATLARGQFVRASRELQGVAAAYHDHPNIGQVPDMLWGIAHELLAKGFFEEANVVFGDLVVRHPAHGHAEQAQRMIAQVYQNNLRQPLRAAETYQELNFARGGNDQALQESIFQIGLQLQGQRRWVEALYVLETFVDSFPNHANAGQALTLLGSIHQTNEAWEDAIAAYRRVISDYGQTAFVKSARWSIAECVINLSRWSEAIGAYRDFIRLYPGDGQSEEAGKRIAILQNLERYQKVVDEEGQRKAFDAQYQIASIVRERLANPIKAIIEFRRVKQRWPESHLADDALYEVGATYLSLGDPERARQALQAVAADYPTSPLADDALYLVGKSYEDEALALISVTRAQSVEMAVEVAQRAAFSLAREGRRKNLSGRAGKVAELKKQGKLDAAANEEASNAAFQGFFANANVGNLARWAEQEAESLTATELADRQDKYDAALRRAVEAYVTASRKAGGDKAGDALLAMAKIQDEQLKDTDAAMTTWLEIVRQFSGTAVAENASWRIAQYYEQAKKHAEAIEALSAFLRNYRRSPKAGDAQIAIAENHEQLGQWVSAMDAYTNYINNFEGGPLVAKAREQIQWIKTYRL